jgi:anti-sigma factor (TIGR02949 family)
MPVDDSEALPTCREVVDHLPEWAEGTLPESAEASYVRHLEVCPPCGDLARSYQAVAEVARAALAVEMPEDARRRLRARLQARFRGDS